jgi:hypothetical protein
MSTAFDPYLDWLGLETSGRAPTHYQLLGVPEFEADPTTISLAADARMAEIRKYQAGPRGQYTHKLLNEITVAKLCLVNARSKAKYDTSLLQAHPPVPTPGYYPGAGYEPEPPAPEVAAPPRTPPAAPPPVSAPPSAPMTSSLSAVEPKQATGGFSAWLYIGAALLVLGIIVGMAYAMFPPRGVGNSTSLTSTADPEASQSVAPQPEPPPLAGPVVIGQEGSGDVNFPLSVAELSGELVRVDEAGETHIHGWQSEDGIARWHFKLVRPAVFQVRMVYKASRSSGNWEFRVGENTKTRELQASEEGASYIDEFIWKVPRGGQQVLELSVNNLPDGPLIALESLRFKKVDLGEGK